MSVDKTALDAKIREMYPEIGAHGLDMSVHFDEAKKAWIVTLVKGENRLDTHVEPEDAEKCLEGVECVYLGHQIGQFVRAYCLRGESCD